ncbi:MAG: hypothetical protein L0Y60_03565 [Beijerinckiaceae bacterium]|nr:hypothetical protein [Beijerinckiaceae bacterium]
MIASWSRKGRPPIGNKAMTAAQRQRRRRKKLAKVKTAAVMKRVAAKKRQEYAKSFSPAPPGITYWRYRQVRMPDNTLSHIPWAETKPLAACRQDLDAGDIFALIRRLSTIARDRGLADEAREFFEAGVLSKQGAIDESNYASGLVVFRDETGSRKDSWACWGWEAGIGRGPKPPLHESPRIPVTEEIEVLVDLELARVLDPEFAITEDIKHRFGVIINEMHGPNEDIAATNLEWLKAGCPPEPPEPPAAPPPSVPVTPEIEVLAARWLARSDYNDFAEEARENGGRISVASLEFINAIAKDSESIVTPPCHDIGAGGSP